MRSRSGNDRDGYANSTMPFRQQNNFLIHQSAQKREGSYDAARNSKGSYNASPIHPSYEPIDRKHMTQEFGR